MPSFATADFEVELSDDVNAEQVKAIVEETVGSALTFTTDLVDEGGYALLQDGTLIVFISTQVSWDFFSKFESLCETLAPLAKGPFESTYVSEDHGGTTTKFWGPDPIEVRNFATRSGLSTMAIAAGKIIHSSDLKLAGSKAAEVGQDENAPGVTFSLQGEGSVMEPVVSVCLAYVSDPGLRESIAMQAHLLATAIAQAKGEKVTGLVSTRARLMPTAMPMEPPAAQGADEDEDYSVWEKQLAIELISAGYTPSHVYILLDKYQDAIREKFEEGVSPAEGAAAMPEIEAQASQNPERPRAN